MVPASHYTTSWALANGIIDDGILGIEVDGEEAHLFRANSFDEHTLLWTGVSELTEIGPAVVSWSGP